MTDLLPPTTSPAANGATPSEPPRRARLVVLIVAVVGSLAILAGLAFALISGLSGRTEQRTYSAPVAGLTSLELSASAADVEVSFGDVSEATLTVTHRGGDARTWTMRRDQEELKVDQDARFAWFAGWWSDGGEQATLVLPRSVEGVIDLDADISAGETTIVGAYRDVDLEASAGSITFTGNSHAVEVSASAGDVNVRTQGPEAVSVSVSAGKVVLSVGGNRAPTATKVEVSAGAAVLTLPDADYAVTQDVSAGSADIGVRTDPASAARLDIEVSAGSARIGYAD